MTWPPRSSSSPRRMRSGDSAASRRWGGGGVLFARVAGQGQRRGAPSGDAYPPPRPDRAAPAVHRRSPVVAGGLCLWIRLGGSGIPTALVVPRRTLLEYRFRRFLSLDV